MVSIDKGLTEKRSTELPMKTDHAEQFWQFSLALYPLLQTELLALQDQYNCNINVLLLTAWRHVLAPLPVLMQGLSPQHLTTQQIRQLVLHFGVKTETVKGSEIFSLLDTINFYFFVIRYIDNK